MVELRRLNGEKFTLNAIMIEQVQSYPDTTITLINGKKIVVQNDEQEVSERVIAFYQRAGLLGTLDKIGDPSE